MKEPAEVSKRTGYLKEDLKKKEKKKKKVSSGIILRNLKCIVRNLANYNKRTIIIRN